MGNKVRDFTLPATGGQTFRLSETKAKCLVLYFYPKDNTPGCTTEGENFRDLHKAFRKAGAEIVMDDTVLPTAFAKMASRVATYAYMQDGTNQFLASFGPAGYHSAAEYLAATGSPLYVSSIGVEDGFRKFGSLQIAQRTLAVEFRALQGGIGLPDRAYYLDDSPKMAELRSKYQQYIGPGRLVESAFQ